MRASIRLAACTALAFACSSGGDDSGPTPTIGVSAGQSAVTLSPGQTATVAVTVSRAGGYSGSITLSLEGAPAGVTGSFVPATLAAGATASTLTLTAAAGAAAGSHTLTIRASGGGVDARTATVGLTLTPAPDFALAVSPGALEVAQGDGGTADVTITRTNFTGTVALSLSGAPAGVTAGITPLSAGGTTAAVAVEAAANAVPGQYVLTVTGMATGLAQRTATFQLTVVAAAPLGISTPEGAEFVVGEAGMLALAATGPGPHTFESVGAPLPDGLELDPATGIIQGVPTAAALLANTPAGEWAGVIVRVGDGRDQVDTDAFSISVVGAPLPAPYAYMAFDDGDLDDAFGARGIPTGTVMPGEAGVIGGAVFVAGAESYVKYPSTLSSRINGKSGVTVATTMKTTSAGTMLFNLSDQFTHWCRVYLGMVNGRLELGGRSQNSNAEAYRAVFGDIPVNDGTFHTVIGVVDLASDRASLYVDGLPDASRTMGFGRTTYESFTPADQNVLGHISTLADSPLAPNVVHDELALWDVALDAREAATVAWLLRRGIALREWIGF